MSRTPVRISLAGGGTDFDEFYRNEPGLVVSATIDKYVYVALKGCADRLRPYVANDNALAQRARMVSASNPIAAEALRAAGAKEQLVIHSAADVPAGTGLGSSSSFTVGLLNALHVAADGRRRSPLELAQEACDLERLRLGEPIGKQDQFAAAYGGLSAITFSRDDSVDVETIRASAATTKALQASLLLFYTGTTRHARSILSRQKGHVADNMNILRRIRDYAVAVRDVLTAGRGLDSIGEILHASWTLKTGLAPGITNPRLDSLYARARAAGAIGGKVLGAGGGGFFLFYARNRDHHRVVSSLPDTTPLPFDFEWKGSQVLL